MLLSLCLTRAAGCWTLFSPLLLLQRWRILNERRKKWGQCSPLRAVRRTWGIQQCPNTTLWHLSALQCPAAPKSLKTWLPKPGYNHHTPLHKHLLQFWGQKCSSSTTKCKLEWTKKNLPLLNTINTFQSYSITLIQWLIKYIYSKMFCFGSDAAGNLLSNK